MDDDLILIQACETGDLSLVKMVDFFNIKNHSVALTKAVSKGHLEIVRYILDNPLCRVAESVLLLALMKAAAKGHLRILKLLRDKVVQRVAQRGTPLGSSNGVTAAFFDKVLFKAIKGGHAQVVKYLIAEDLVSDLETALYKAVKFNHRNIVKLLSTPKVVQRPWYGTLMLEACSRNHLGVLHFMTDKRGKNLSTEEELG